MTQVERASEFDGVKGIAITLMVFGHLTYSGSMAHRFSTITGFIYTFHMPLFLLMSGYFFSPVRPTSNALQKTVRGILVPFFIFEAVYLLLLLYAQSKGIHTNNQINSSIGEFFSMLFLHPVGAYWFLHTLCLFQLTAILSVFVTRKIWPALWFPVMTALLLAAMWADFVGMRSVVFLLMGVAFRQVKIKLPTSMWMGIPAAVALFFFCNALIFSNQLILQIVWVLAILASIAGFFKIFPNAPTAKVWVFLGRNTLIIMLTHVYFVNVAKALAGKINTFDPTGISYVALSTFVGIAGPLAIAKLFDYVSLSHLLFGQKKLYISPEMPWALAEHYSARYRPRH